MEFIEHNEVFDLAYRFITETAENVFLTGKAGTGKTTFLKYLRENAVKNIIVAAPTGVAAINAGGVTLHSLFQLPFHPFLPTKNHKEELISKSRIGKQRLQLLRKMELLIIDEISMVRADTMDAIDTILKHVRKNHIQPFGGIQLLCIGDLFQLPPVAQNHEWSILSEYYSSPFFFDSMAIKEQMPLLIELNKIYRQKEDSFVRLLNKIRNNQMEADDFEDLAFRYHPNFVAGPDEKYITLTSHNNQADTINQQALYKLNGSAFNYSAIVEDDFPENMYPAEASLELKEGAQVMFLKNDNVFKRYYNGKIGTVKWLEADKIIVDCDGTEIEVGKETWENSRYVLNRQDEKLEQEVLGCFTQYPLRLAWAITIHKSQGLTFDKVMIDAGSAFSSGQVYVALSRCTSLEGIVLLSKITPAVIFNNEKVKSGQQSLVHRGSLTERFEGARQVFTQQLLEGLFSFDELVITIDYLYNCIGQHKEKLNNDAQEWCRLLKENIYADKGVGIKFNSLIASLMKSEAIVEKNELLQNRITDAANHFIPKLQHYLKTVTHHPLITEHKEAATVINESLLELAVSLHKAIYYLENCRIPFSVTAFLQHKLQYSLPVFKINCYASGKNQTVKDIAHTELFDTLKRWRDLVCQEEHLPIYMVANQNSLKEICLYLPMQKKDLLQLSGFGKAKVEKYGEDILAAVESYCLRHQIDSNMGAFETVVKKEKKTKSAVTKVDTKTQSFQLFKEGKSIKEIAKERGFTISTIESHLAHFVETGSIAIGELVNQQKQNEILKAIEIHGRQSHKILLENLPAGTSYGEIRLVLAAHPE
ncbi:MAG: helix-turn-helix domain-containing protein [Chitinophagaceae bacterium]